MTEQNESPNSDGLERVTLTYRGKSVTLDANTRRRADEAMKWLADEERQRARSPYPPKRNQGADR